jgi:hypothetical protein
MKEKYKEHKNNNQEQQNVTRKRLVGRANPL